MIPKLPITLWGPTGAGKTWLINAFVKKINFLHSNSQEFKYRLYKYPSKEPSFVSPKSISPTSDPEHNLFLFERIGPNLNSYKYQLSSHSHLLSIRDSKGSNTLSMLEKPDNSRMTLVNTINAEGIIIVLDPTMTSTNSNRDQTSESIISSELLSPPLDDKNQYERYDVPIARHEYFYWVNELINVLEKYSSRRGGPFFAACITKVDLLSKGMYKRDPWDLIDGYFGREMVDILRSRVNVEAFAVSSYGFLRDEYPNYDSASGGLMNISEWSPLNVESPFFWIFQNIELKRLSQSTTIFDKLFNRAKYYIPYPRPEYF